MQIRNPQEAREKDRGTERRERGILLRRKIMIVLCLFLVIPAGRASLSAADRNRASGHIAPQGSAVSARKLSKDGTKRETAPRGMVLVRGGCYRMGCGTWPSDCDDDSKPAHEICLDDFYIDRYPVTQAAYQRVMGRNPSHFKGMRHPIENVTWFNAQAYCTKVGKRLPTEAEWEYAARGGRNMRNRKKPRGDTLFLGDPECNGCGSQWDNRSTSPVGSFPPNSLGLYGMVGNLFEWCVDWYDAGYYGRSPKDNPRGALRGTKRVIRGRSWLFEPGFFSAWDRIGDEPDDRNEVTGFRCAGSLEGRQHVRRKERK
ncbi:MAG: formylglycine-generating enzyme family protein [Deltaproteobacteria bacterium]|nr:formylglycine-generating enzyme family protein [Deltaproteobacteria bacterium]